MSTYELTVTLAGSRLERCECARSRPLGASQLAKFSGPTRDGGDREAVLWRRYGGAMLI